MPPNETDQLKQEIVRKAVARAIDDHKVPARQLLTALQKISEVTNAHSEHMKRHETHMYQHERQLTQWDNIVQYVTSLTHLKGEKGDSVEGKPGRNGKSPRIQDIVDIVMSLIPPPEAGTPGRDAVFDSEEVYKKFVARMKKEKVLDVSDIGNSQSFLFNKKRYKIEELMKGGGPILTGRGSIQSYDISSQFNGVLTTFTIPQYLSIIQFIITGWPPNGVLRPTVDFTTPTSTTVALVPASVSAPVNGTSGIILYVSA